MFEPYCEQLIECDSGDGFDARIARRLRTALVCARERLLQRIDSVI